MTATLTLDDDVAALLERAHQQRGRSPRELANEVLRRTLPHLDAVPAPPEQPDTSLEARIDQVYDEIRDLVGSLAKNPELKAEIELKRQQLHALQAEEAEAWRRRAEARRHLKPGEGYRLLERAEGLLAS